MRTGFDYACKIDTNWERNLKPCVDPLLSFLVKIEIVKIKQCCQDKNYSEALPIVQMLVNGFNPDYYKDKPWGNHATEVLEDLNELEKTLTSPL